MVVGPNTDVAGDEVEVALAPLTFSEIEGMVLMNVRVGLGYPDSSRAQRSMAISNGRDTEWIVPKYSMYGRYPVTPVP